VWRGGWLRFRLRKKNSEVRNDKHLKRELRASSLANNIFKKQNSLKIKTQEHRPRKRRHGGDRTAFATPSRVPSKEKNTKKNKSSRVTRNLQQVYEWGVFENVV